MTGGVTVSGGTLQLAGQSGGTGTLPNNTYVTVNNNAALLVNGRTCWAITRAPTFCSTTGWST